MKPVILILALVLSGCATIKGIEISDEERAACEAQGCTVWTQEELQRLAKQFFLQGYQAGRKSL